MSLSEKRIRVTTDGGHTYEGDWFETLTKDDGVWLHLRHATPGLPERLVRLESLRTFQVIPESAN